MFAVDYLGFFPVKGTIFLFCSGLLLQILGFLVGLCLSRSAFVFFLSLVNITIVFFGLFYYRLSAVCESVSGRGM